MVGDLFDEVGLIRRSVLLSFGFTEVRTAYLALVRPKEVVVVSSRLLGTQ